MNNGYGRILLIVIGFPLFLGATHAQEIGFPFPQSAGYPYGIMGQAIDSADADSSYVRWKERYVTGEGAGGFRRVLWDDSTSTVSEGIGYGMLLAVNHGDRDLFDDLWGYYQGHANAHGLMGWKVDGQGNLVDESAATDADEDVAFSLVLADTQWGSEGSIDYLRAAEILIEAIWTYEVEPETYVLKPGDTWGGSSVTISPTSRRPTTGSLRRAWGMEGGSR